MTLLIFALKANVIFALRSLLECNHGKGHFYLVFAHAGKCNVQEHICKIFCRRSKCVVKMYVCAQTLGIKNGVISYIYSNFTVLSFLHRSKFHACVNSRSLFSIAATAFTVDLFSLANLM